MKRLSMLALLALTTPALANDSVAGFALGGLELRQTDAVRMVSEVLVLSPQEVSVDYIFRNTTAAPVSAIVAFPLPELARLGEDSDHAIPFPDKDNYVGFETRIDGIPVPLGIEHRARLNGADITADLRALGVDLIASMDSTRLRQSAAGWSPAQRQALAARGFLDDQGLPAWHLQTTFWRSQTFPPGTDVAVSHRYRPVAGGSVDSVFPRILPPADADAAWHDSMAWRLDWQEQATARYCPEPEVETLLRERLNQPDDQRGFVTYGSREIGYVLTTGAHWQGPIGQFHLTVFSPDPDDAVFLCLPGAQREAPNRITFAATDFTPRQDLLIHVTDAIGGPGDGG